MSSKSPLLLVAIGLVLACGVGWLLLSEPQSEAELVAGTEPSVAADPVSSSAELLTPEVVEATRDVAPVVEPKRAATPKPVSHTDSIWVEGRIAFPSDTPTDELVTVIARGKKFSGKENDPKSYETEADASGRFKVAFAKGTKRGRLSLRAKYLYLEKTVKLTRKDFEAAVLLEPLLGGCIEITLLAPPGTPLSEEEIGGCEIGGWKDDDDFNFSSITAELIEGSLFRVSALEPGTGYELSLDSGDFVNFERSDLEVKAGEITQISFELEVGGRVTGRVVDRAGEPVSEAEVTFEAAGQWRSESTNELGEFERGGLPGGDLTISISKEGFVAVEDTVLRIRAGESSTLLEIVMERGHTIAGTVAWPDGTPVAEAQVVVTQEAEDGEDRFFSDESEFKATTAADGSFLVTGLGENLCVVEARAKPELKAVPDESERERKRRKKAQPFWNMALDRVAPSSGSVALILREGAGISGVVVDDVGDAIEDFRVIAREVEESDWIDFSAERVSLKVKDSVDGSFLLEGLKDGVFDVHATARGHKTLIRRRIEVPWKGGLLRLVLPRTALLSGAVYDLAGQPVVGARVEHVYEEGEDARGVFEFTDSADKTDKHGVYKFKSLAAGVSRVRATAEGHASGEWQTVTLESGQERTGFTLSLRRGATLTGVVHPSVGKVAGLTINLEHSRPSPDSSTTSDSNGEFRFENVDPGEYDLSLEPDMSDVDDEASGYWTIMESRSKEVTIELVDGEQSHIVLGAPSGTPIVVTGLVSVGGRPVVGELVAAEAAREGRRIQPQAIHTDAAGHYTLTLDGPGYYVFTVGDGYGESVDFGRQIPNQESFRCDLALPTSSLTGTVTGPGGKLLAGIGVTLAPHPPKEDAEATETTYRETETNALGRFTFDWLQPATYDLRAGGSELWSLSTSGKYGRMVVGSLVIEEGKRHEDLKIDLPIAGTVKGTIRDASGALLPDISIRVLLESGHYLEGWGGNLSDSSGRFTIRGLAPGTVRVFAELDEGVSPEVSVEVFSGEKAEIELVVD